MSNPYEPNQPDPNQPGSGQPYGNQSGAPTATGEDPGRTLGIISIVGAFFFAGLPGIIIGAIARSKSKAAGFNNTLAKVGLILGIVFLVLSVVGGIIIGVVTFGAIAEACQQLGPGTHEVNGTTYTCS